MKAIWAMSNYGLEVGEEALVPLQPHMLSAAIGTHFATASLNLIGLQDRPTATVAQAKLNRSSNRIASWASAMLHSRGGIFHFAARSDFASNEAFWKAALEERTFVSQEVILRDFLLLEWYPRCPGLYHMPRAEHERRSALRFILERKPISHKGSINVGIDHASQSSIRTVFNPYGKACMINGGIGAIRLRPLSAAGGERLHMMTATSTGVCHEGIPLGLPDALYQEVIQEIRRNGAVRVTLHGEVDFVPDDMSKLYRRYAKLPQLFVRIRNVEAVAGDRLPVTVCPTITFSSAYEGELKSYACYVTVDLGDDDIDTNVDWMADEYVQGRYKGALLTDFDQTKAHFDNIIFSLDRVMNFDVSVGELINSVPNISYYIETFAPDYVSMLAENVRIGGVMGDVFSNISNSTIINRSLVKRAFTRAQEIADKETAQALVEVARIVQEAKNPDAEKLLAEFMKKLDEKEPSKPILRAIWDGIKEAVPMLKGMTEIGTAVAKLFI